MARGKSTPTVDALVTEEVKTAVVEEVVAPEPVKADKTYKVKVLREQKFYHGDRWYYFIPGETYNVNMFVRERLKKANNIDI